MLKAIFLDYNGTTVKNGGPAMEEAVGRVIRNSTIPDLQAFQKVWWYQIRTRESLSTPEHFVSEEEISRQSLQYFVDHYQLQDDVGELFALIEAFWRGAPVYEDVPEFFAACPVPVYIISNNGACYISERCRTAGLQPAGFVCGEMVKCFKPHTDLYRKALELSGCRPEEAVHIGDSLTSDYLAARSVGIPSILLDRESKCSDPEVLRAGSLQEALALIRSTFSVPPDAGM